MTSSVPSLNIVQAAPSTTIDQTKPKIDESEYDFYTEYSPEEIIEFRTKAIFGLFRDQPLFCVEREKLLSDDYFASIIRQETGIVVNVKTFAHTSEPTKTLQMVEEAKKLVEITAEVAAEKAMERELAEIARQGLQSAESSTNAESLPAGIRKLKLGKLKPIKEMSLSKLKNLKTINII